MGRRLKIVACSVIVIKSKLLIFTLSGKEAQIVLNPLKIQS